MTTKKIFCFLYLFFFSQSFFLYAQSGDTTVMHVKKTNDFTITGEGSSVNWNNTNWFQLFQRNTTGINYQTKAKILYSDSGIYCLYKCDDTKIVATLNGDFLDLWTEDVVEAFFWTDESVPIYVEYEVSPLNYELPILVPNFKGDFLGWRPWRYEGNRKTKHATHINKSGETVSSWTAEFFIPYALLEPLQNVPPRQGTKWRANFYRIDHDKGDTEWSWQLTRTNFHDYERFGTIVFE